MCAVPDKETMPWCCLAASPVSPYFGRAYAFAMTREEAERRASALNSHGSEERWFARKHAHGWEVVKVALPPGVRLDPLKEAVPQATRPTPAGPPPAHHRHFDGAGGAGGV